MNPLIQGKSGTTPVMSRNAFSTNQGTNEDDSQSDPHPEAGVRGNQTMRKSGQKDRRDMVTAVQRNSFCGRGMVTGATKQIGNRRDMVTGVHEEVKCCPEYIFRKAEKEPFYQSTAIPQREYSCDDRGRPNFVGPPTVGKQQKFCELS